MNTSGNSTPQDAEPASGLLDTARRITGAGAEAATRRLTAAIGNAQALAGNATGRVAATVNEARDAVVQSLPDAKTVKAGVGRALILGGRALMDPQAVVGSFAIELGQRLTTHDPGPVWLSLVATDDGFELLARGNEAEVRAAAAEAVAQQRAVLVCKVVEAHRPAGSTPASTSTAGP